MSGMVYCRMVLYTEKYGHLNLGVEGGRLSPKNALDTRNEVNRFEIRRKRGRGGLRILLREATYRLIEVCMW